MVHVKCFLFPLTEKSSNFRRNAIVHLIKYQKKIKFSEYVFDSRIQLNSHKN